jgi:hypothetical protein
MLKALAVRSLQADSLAAYIRIYIKDGEGDNAMTDLRFTTEVEKRDKYRG